MALLEGRHLFKRFGAVTALNDVSFSIEAQEVVALIGPNGSGKTTLFNIISGLTPPDSGDVRFGKVIVSGNQPHLISRLGIGRTFQIPSPFPSLTVLDNVVVGIVHRKRDRKHDLDGARDEARHLLGVVGLDSFAERSPRGLSLGELKRLELACALSLHPTLLLIDELGSGLSPKGRSEVVHFYGRLRERRGLTVFAIEHSFRALAATADRVMVLDHGRIIADGPPEEVLATRGVVEAYLGEDED